MYVLSVLEQIDYFINTYKIKQTSYLIVFDAYYVF